MTDPSVYYGVRKLVVINSGKYSYAEIDLTGPVHLAAPNNRGKSTLVNALQFLYVDELRFMRFGSRSHDDTRQHYFGADPSYLVFECMTPLGPKCLLVAGQGRLNNCHFLRFVYEGVFELNDFRNDQQLLYTLEQLRPRLAGRGLAEVKPGNLWEVLGDPKTATPNSNVLPRLNILPVRTKDEYRSFRDAFIRLLSLSNVSAKELRELLITCYARDITCSRIDVAVEHREEFERAEQANRTLQFTKAVMPRVESGRLLRDNMAAHARQLRIEASPIGAELARVRELLHAVGASVAEQEQSLTVHATQLSERSAELNQHMGALRQDQKSRKKEMDEIDGLRRRWAACTDEMMENMRGNSIALNNEIVRLRDQIDQSERLDIDAIRRRVMRLEGEVKSKQRTLANWDTRATNTLREMGLSNDDMQSLFRVFNPRLLDLSVGKDVRIPDGEKLRNRLQAIQKHIVEDRYQDDAVEIDLSQIHEAEFTHGATQAELQHDLMVTQGEFDRVKSQLAVAENYAAAKQKLAATIAEQDGLNRRLDDYNDYVARWAVRDQLQKSYEEMETKIVAAEEEIERVRQEAERLKPRQIALGEAQQGSVQALNELARVEEEYQRLQLDAELDAPLVTGDATDLDRVVVAEWEGVRPQYESLGVRLAQMQESARSVSAICRQLAKLQKDISEVSRQHPGQTVYFSDVEEDWKRLIEMVESVAEQEQAVEQAWTSLFTRLAAKLDGIKQGVSEIRSAVTSINHGLADYRVRTCMKTLFIPVPNDEA